MLLEVAYFKPGFGEGAAENEDGLPIIKGVTKVPDSKYFFTPATAGRHSARQFLYAFAADCVPSFAAVDIVDCCCIWCILQFIAYLTYTANTEMPQKRNAH